MQSFRHPVILSFFSFDLRVRRATKKDRHDLWWIIRSFVSSYNSIFEVNSLYNQCTHNHILMKQFHNHKSAPDLVTHPSKLMARRWSLSFFMTRIKQLRISIKMIWLVNTTQWNLDGNSREQPAQRGYGQFATTKNSPPQNLPPLKIKSPPVAIFI